MAKRKYHILHGKTKSQRDALVKNPGLRLLHANASGFYDFEQNPGRRRRLKAMKNPDVRGPGEGKGGGKGGGITPDEWSELFAEVGKGGVTVTPDRRIKGAKIKGKRPEMKASDDWSGAREVLEEMAEKEEAVKADAPAPTAAKKKGKSKAKGKRTGSTEATHDVRGQGKWRPRSGAGAGTAITGTATIDEPGHLTTAGDFSHGRRTTSPRASGAKKKDIIDRLAEGIGSIADVWGERKPRGPKGAATKETIVGFDALATLKGLNAEQAAKVGYQLGVMRGIDTCGVFKARERKAIRQKANMELQNAVASLEQRIIGKV